MAGSSGQIRTVSDVARLGTILSVWAHPDDEPFLAAGIMAAGVRNGQTVVCVTATKGEKGSQDERKWPTATLAAVRALEMASVLKVSGITHHHWLGYHDGECEKVSPDEAVAQIQKLIERYKPDSILTFGPEGWTGHGDHATVSRWVSRAVAKLDLPPVVYHFIGTSEHFEHYLKRADEKINIFFNIDKPPIVPITSCAIYFKLPSNVCRLKHQALAASPSQTETLLKLFDQTFLDKAFTIEIYVRTNERLVQTANSKRDGR